jgi:predicted phosphodiesterase
MKILVAGDTHANLSHALKIVDAAQNRGCSKIIQVGDFGFWPGADRGFSYLLDKELQQVGINLYFIDGNHENHICLDQTNKDFYHPNYSPDLERIYHIPRGLVWEWDSVSFLGIGGAYSIDKNRRREGIDYFPQEDITQGDYLRAIANFDTFSSHSDKNKIDVMISHDAPTGVNLFGEREHPDRYSQSISNRQFLREIAEVIKPAQIIHGHHHLRHTKMLELDSGYQTLVQGLDRDSRYSFDDSFIVIDTKDDFKLSES